MIDASTRTRAGALANATGHSAADVLLHELDVPKTAIADADEDE